jgi:uncharacterized protein YukE
VSWNGDPEELDRLARGLSVEAAQVRSRIGVIRSFQAAARWRGSAADAFHAAVLRECGSLERAAHQLDDAAAALRAHAEAVRDALARPANAHALRMLADMVQDVVAA